MSALLRCIEEVAATACSHLHIIVGEIDQLEKKPRGCSSYGGIFTGGMLIKNPNQLLVTSPASPDISVFTSPRRRFCSLIIIV